MATVLTWLSSTAVPLSFEIRCDFTNVMIIHPQTAHIVVLVSIASLNEAAGYVSGRITFGSHPCWDGFSGWGVQTKAGVISGSETPRCYRRVSDALNKHTGVYENDYIKGVGRCYRALAAFSTSNVPNAF
jgi:hypothetical protein